MLSAGVLSAGIVVVDHVAAAVPALPRAGELVLTSDCRLHIGGCAANVAIDLGRLGVRSHVVGAVGDDLFGQFARRVLEDNGVDASGLVVCNGLPTSQTLVVNVAHEDRRFIHLIGANGALTASMLPTEWNSTTRVLYLGGLFLLDGLDVGDLSRVFQAARSAGVATVLDVVTPGSRDYASDLKRVLPHTDFFLPNEDEAACMTGRADPVDQARCLVDWGASAVAITRGASGSLFASKGELWQIDAYKIPFVDGTGGGDAFTAGFIAGVLEGRTPLESLRIASAMGASCVRANGATEGVFSKEELLEFLRNHSLECRPLKF